MFKFFNELEFCLQLKDPFQSRQQALLHPKMPSEELSFVLARWINTTIKMAAARVMRGLRGICSNNNIKVEILNLLIIKLKIKNEIFPSLMIPFNKKSTPKDALDGNMHLLAHTSPPERLQVTSY